MYWTLHSIQRVCRLRALKLWSTSSASLYEINLGVLSDIARRGFRGILKDGCVHRTQEPTGIRNSLAERSLTNSYYPDQPITKGLNDKFYDKRKAAALDLEKFVPDAATTHDRHG